MVPSTTEMIYGENRKYILYDFKAEDLFSSGGYFVPEERWTI